MDELFELLKILSQKEFFSIFIIFGLVCIFISIIGRYGIILDLSLVRQIILGSVGLIFLLTGVFLAISPEPNPYIETSFRYSFLNQKGNVSLKPGDSFTIHDALGGCPPNNDVAICTMTPDRRLMASNKDSCAPKTKFGPKVSKGCSPAESQGFTVECCFIEP